MSIREWGEREREREARRNRATRDHRSFGGDGIGQGLHTSPVHQPLRGGGAAPQLEEPTNNSGRIHHSTWSGTAASASDFSASTEVAGRRSPRGTSTWSGSSFTVDLEGELTGMLKGFPASTTLTISITGNSLDDSWTVDTDGDGRVEFTGVQVLVGDVITIGVA